MVKDITLAVLSAVGGIAFLCGKFFLYNGEYEGEGKETIKILCIILDTFKDIGVAWAVLNFLLK